MRECVLQHGPAVSLDRVADQLEVTSPALIKRFGSRRALMIAALRPPEGDDWLKHLKKGPDGRPLVVQLEELMGHFSDFFTQVMPCVSALRESGIPHSELYRANEQPPLLRGVQALRRWLEQARVRGLVDGAPLEAASTAIVGAIIARVFAAHLAQRSWPVKSQRDYVKQLAQLFTRALAPQPDGPPQS